MAMSDERGEDVVLNDMTDREIFSIYGGGVE